MQLKCTRFIFTFILPAFVPICIHFVKIRYFENSCIWVKNCTNIVFSVICIVYTIVIAYYTFQSIRQVFRLLLVGVVHRSQPITDRALSINLKTLLRSEYQEQSIWTCFQSIATLFIHWHCFIVGIPIFRKSIVDISNRTPIFPGRNMA